MTSCLPMVGMLPGGVAGVLGLVGLGASSGVAIWLSTNLAPVGAPLLLASTMVLAAASLACSRLAVSAALSGGTLMYLSMYVLVRGDGATTSALFYPGLALFLGSYMVPAVQRRRRGCRPMVSPKRGQLLLLGALLGGAALVVATVVFGLSFGTSPSGGMPGMGG